jgi:hypothetical protein
VRAGRAATGCYENIYCPAKSIKYANSFEESINAESACGRATLLVCSIVLISVCAIAPVGFTERHLRSLRAHLPAVLIDDWRAFSRKNLAVTWCYNPSPGITLFGSTRFGAAHKLLHKGYWNIGRRNCCAPVALVSKQVRRSSEANPWRIVGQVNYRGCRVFEQEALGVGRACRSPGLVRPCETCANAACR